MTRNNIDIIEAFLDGKTPDKADAIIQSLIAKDSSKELSDLLASEWQKEQGTRMEDADLEAALEEFHRRQDLAEGKRRTLRVLRRLALAAACIAVPVVIGLAVWSYMVDYNYECSQMVELVVPNGEVRHLALSDGTDVMLNSGSVFYYPRKFNRWKGNREVYLLGEGTFKVSHDGSHPFIVHASEMSIRVLGTVFNINAYPKDDAFVTTLSSGLVEASACGLSKRIHPKESLVYKREGRRMDLLKADPEKDFAWNQGNLVFDNQTLAEIAKVLARHFDKDVKISKSVNTNARYTMSFRKTESLDNVLDVLMAVSPDLKCKANGTTISITGK